MKRIKILQVSSTIFSIENSIDGIGLGEMAELIPKIPIDVFLGSVWPLFFEGGDRLGQVETLLNLRLLSKFWVQFVDDSEEMFQHQLHLVHCMSEDQYRTAPGRFKTWSHKYDPRYFQHH